MKRSDMLMIIKDAFLNSYGLDEEHILIKIEEAGMLPPPTDIEYGVTSRLCYVEYDYMDMDEDIPDSLWEPEIEDRTEGTDDE